MDGLMGSGKGAANALSQLGNREGIDRSLFHDRHAGPSATASRGTSQVHQSHHHPAAQQGQSRSQPFNLSHLSAALSQPPQQIDFSADWERAHQHQRAPGPGHQPQTSSTFSSDFQQWSGPSQRENWAEGYTAKGKGRMMSPPPMAHEQQMPYHQAYQPRMPIGQSFMPMYQGSMAMSQPQVQYGQQATEGRQMNQVEQEKMEAAFEQALADAREQSTSIREEEGVVKEKEAEPPAEEMRETKGDLEAVWESLRPEAERLNKLAEWERDFSQFTNDEDDLFETLNDSLHREDVGQHGLDEQLNGFWPGESSTDPDVLREYNEWKSRSMPENGIPEGGYYEWAGATPFNHLPADQSWQQANELLATGGSLSDVTLHLENYLRRSRSAPEMQPDMPASEVEAWSLLGRVHAMNEKEDRALTAFESGRRALERPGISTNGAGEMLTNLAISYVNESEDLAALTTLHQYLSLVHPDFAGAAPTRSQMTESESPWALHQTLTDSFLALARDQYGSSRGTVDPDVQVGLGTAYYMMGEYEEARNCWVAALGERPDDYLLWNRLGATLANGGNPEEAVDAYRRALELKPTFTRAIFNLGVACLNIGVHKEAAEHFLAALSMHTRLGEEDAKRYDSLSIWSTLRRALVAMDLNDLASQANPGSDLEIFRQAGFTF